ncbi:hypothetical protein AZI85_12255 [Bdellovibrio bacteriovorus]|uniref:Uncharacterized protein n=2 Tax=Bdellovibrio bacteriovorus TaxID=959 RepID=A0A150WCQ0_BDEBC|nr:hypothetical protein AZI85_12255 [Bdellovibrio bacteriovorus]
MGFTDKDLCTENVKSAQEELKKFSENINEAVAFEAAGKMIDASCSSLMDRKSLKLLKNNLAKVLLDGNPYDKCFNSAEFKKAFQKTKNNEVFLELLKSRDALQRKKLVSSPPESLIRCENEKESKSVAKTNEKGQITLFVPESKSLEIQPVHLQHEFLHRIGVVEDKDVNNILNSCKKGAIQNGVPKFVGALLPNSTTAFSQVNAKESANVKTDKVETVKRPVATSTAKESNVPTAKAAARSVASENTANVPKSLVDSQTGSPPPAQLAQVISNPPPQTEAGAQQAYETSTSQSGGVFRAANNLMGSMNTPAEASTRLAKQGSDSEIGETTSSSLKKSSVTSSSVPATAALRSRNTIGSDERIVESITLDGSGSTVVTPTPVQQRNQQVSSTNPTNTRQTVSNESKQQQRMPSSELGSAPSVSSGGSTGGASSASLGNSSPNISGTQQIPSRASNKSSGGSANNQNSASKEEVITFISRSEYASAKRKLKDPDFSKQLEAQSISIYDLYGNTYGAKKGEVIFLDQGDKFVRQK